MGLGVEGAATFADAIQLLGDLAVGGNKNFVAPHPTDPAKQIAFVSLEGPESGTYFRGTAQLLGGYAQIAVPESFRLVTSPSGLTVIATPSTSAAVLYCESKSLENIVIRGSEDVEFDYVVNGVRAGYEIISRSSRTPSSFRGAHPTGRSRGRRPRRSAA